MRRCARHVVAVLSCALLVASCGGSDAPAALPSTTKPAVPKPVVVATSRPAAPAPTAKPSPTPPARPVRKPAADGDVDGDGRRDTVSVTTVASGDGVWPVTVRATAVGQRRGQVHAGADAPRVLGVVDADGDGFAEVFVRVTQGASTEFVAVLRLVEGVLRELTLDGEPAQLGVGGSVTHGSGFACRDDRRDTPGRELVLYEGETADGETWTGTITTLAWNGGVLARVAERTESFPVTSGDEPRLRPYYAVSCGSLAG